jgi:hypothetical protein
MAFGWVPVAETGDASPVRSLRATHAIVGTVTERARVAPSARAA